MIVTLDTNFLMLHYFSKEETVLSRTRDILRACRRLGNRGIVPTIVLAEFHALTHKRAGMVVADKCFNELVNSGLKVTDLTLEISREAAVLRVKYEEKIPWADCIIAATACLNRSHTLLSEDPHFKKVREVNAKTLSELRI